MASSSSNVNSSDRSASAREPVLELGEGAVALDWSFHLERTPPEALWPWISDTSALNAQLGLPLMEFEEREGARWGSMGSGWLRHEWREIPWEWQNERFLRAERHYTRGLARRVVVRYQLEPKGEGTHFDFHIEWEPRYWWARPLLRYANHWLKKRYIDVLRARDRQGVQAVVPIEEGEHGDVQEDLLQAGMPILRERGVSEVDAERLAAYLREASDEALFRVRPKALAFEWGVELDELLPVLLHAARLGWLRLSWDVLCPHCQGVRRESRSLGDLRELGRCDICDIDFAATSQEAIEVTFRVSPEIREVREVLYCSAEPAKKPHIYLQKRIEAGETLAFGANLSPGRYRLRRAVRGESTLALEVSSSGRMEYVEWDTGREGHEGPLAVSPTIQLQVANSLREPAGVVLEKLAEDPTVLRPSEIFNFQAFRDLFSEESIATGLKLEMGHQTLLFADVVGSTRLYEEWGDAKAFQWVRSHFVALQKIVEKHRGAVVKTIGDGLMAGFRRPQDALEAALEIGREFRPGGEQPLDLRVALHRGPCLAVRLDTQIDYFGTAVNYAAKMERLAQAGEVVFSKEFLEWPELQERLGQRGHRLRERPFAFPARKGEKEDSVFLLAF
jgi:class 3 adenylate cyclase